MFQAQFKDRDYSWSLADPDLLRTQAYINGEWVDADVGCAMVAKPPHETPLSILALAVLAERAGLPAGLLSILPTADAEAVGDEMCENPTVRKLTFTGSTAVGKLLTKQCADTLKRLSMELGGIKESGQGREGSRYGIDEYVETKFICLGNLGG